MAYVKLFESILASTIWDADSATRVVWITMLAMADRDGIVESSVPGLAHLSRVTREECDRALQVLSAPDPDSRTKDHDGRRISAIPGGWKILNYEHYRSRASADDVREKARLRQQRKRERDASRAVTRNHKSNDIAEAEAEAPAEAAILVPDSGELRSDSVGSGLSGSGSGSAIRSLMEVGFGGKNFGQVIEFAKQLAQMGLDDADVRDLCRAAAKGKNPAGLLQSWVKRGDTEKVLARARA